MSAQYHSATVGIDLGGTSARIAFVDDEGNVHVLADSLGRTSLPTNVFLDPDSSHPVLGESATALALGHPDGLVRRVVSILERDRSHVWSLGNREYRPRDLCSLILRELNVRACSFLGVSHAETVIAVPCHFGQLEREEIRRAGERTRDSRQSSFLMQRSPPQWKCLSTTTRTAQITCWSATWRNEP